MAVKVLRAALSSAQDSLAIKEVKFPLSLPMHGLAQPDDHERMKAMVDVVFGSID